MDKPLPPSRRLGTRSIASPHVVTIGDLRRLAERRLPRVVFDYIDGGADAEITLHPLMGGLPPDEGTASLDLFTTEVLPELARRGVWIDPRHGGESGGST